MSNISKKNNLSFYPLKIHIAIPYQCYILPNIQLTMHTMYLLLLHKSCNSIYYLLQLSTFFNKLFFLRMYKYYLVIWYQHYKGAAQSSSSCYLILKRNDKLCAFRINWWDNTLTRKHVFLKVSVILPTYNHYYYEYYYYFHSTTGFLNSLRGFLAIKPIKHMTMSRKKFPHFEHNEYF